MQSIKDKWKKQATIPEAGDHELIWALYDHNENFKEIRKTICWQVCPSLIKGVHKWLGANAHEISIRGISRCGLNYSTDSHLINKYVKWVCRDSVWSRWIKGHTWQEVRDYGIVFDLEDPDISMRAIVSTTCALRMMVEARGIIETWEKFYDAGVQGEKALFLAGRIRKCDIGWKMGTTGNTNHYIFCEENNSYSIMKNVFLGNVKKQFSIFESYLYLFVSELWKGDQYGSYCHDWMKKHFPKTERDVWGDVIKVSTKFPLSLADDLEEELARV